MSEPTAAATSITREQVLRAALRTIDLDGVELLSMRRLRPLAAPLALLVHNGFSDVEALHVYRLFVGFLYGHVLNELQEVVDNPERDRRPAPPRAPPTTDQGVPGAAKTGRRHPPQGSPHRGVPPTTRLTHHPPEETP